jgi:hypothetical protein
MAEVISYITGESFKVPKDDEIKWYEHSVNSYFYHELCYNRFHKKRNFSHDKFMNYHLLQMDYASIERDTKINVRYLVENDCMYDEKFKIFIPKILTDEIDVTIPGPDKMITHDVNYKVYRLNISPKFPNYYGQDVKPMFAVNIEQSHMPYDVNHDAYVAYGVKFDGFSTAAAGYHVAIPRLTKETAKTKSIEINALSSVNILFNNVQLKNPKELLEYPDLFILDKESKLTDLCIRWDFVKSYYNKGQNHFYYLLIKLINMSSATVVLEDLDFRSGIIFHPPTRYREALYNDFNQTMKYNISKIFEKIKFPGDIKSKGLITENDILYPTNLCQVLNPSHEDLLKPPVHPSVTIESILNNSDEETGEKKDYETYIAEIERAELAKSWKRVFCDISADIKSATMPYCDFKSKYNFMKYYPYVSEF